MAERFENGFSGRVAVVTGGGGGIGRELVRQLAAEGCDVAFCDVSVDNATETVDLCRADGSPGEVITEVVDVSDEPAVLAFADAVRRWRPELNLVVNNAGVGGGGTIIDGDRAQWDRVFEINWFGVYHSTLAFVPLLVAAPVAHLVNVSSVSSFFATRGEIPFSAYCAGKAAVKGFTEALIADFARNAPHVHVSLAMPGHIGTRIADHSGSLLGHRARVEASGQDVSDLSDDEVVELVEAQIAASIEAAPTLPDRAAEIILDGVRADRWRILVGEDAEMIDRLVRADPDAVYTPEFYDRWVAMRVALGKHVRG